MPEPVCDRIFSNARLLTCDPAKPGLGLIERGAIATKNGRIVYAGRAGRARPGAPVSGRNYRHRRTPGDPRADRLPHASGLRGDRAGEWEMRQQGATYEEIARAGGGILSTVKATRAAGRMIWCGRRFRDSTL